MAELDEQSPSARKSVTKGFWDKTTGIQKGLLILALAFPFYIAYTTALIPNYQCIYSNGSIEYPTEQIDDASCGVLYAYGDKVPKSFMSNGQAFIESIFILALFLSLFTQKIYSRIPIPEAINIVKSELSKIQKLPTMEGEEIELKGKDIIIPTGVITRSRKTMGEWKEFRYTIGMKVMDKSRNVERYYKSMINPNTGYFDGFIPTDEEMKDWDMCSKCGKEYDVKQFTEEDLKMFFDIRKGMGGGR